MLDERRADKQSCHWADKNIKLDLTFKVDAGAYWRLIMNLAESLLEKYVLSGGDQSFFKQLVPGSNQHFLFYMLHSLKQGSVDIADQPKDPAFTYSHATNIQLKQALWKLESDSPSCREVARSFLIQFLNLNFDFHKPHNVVAAGSTLKQNIANFKSRLQPKLLQTDQKNKNKHQVLTPFTITPQYIVQLTDKLKVCLTLPCGEKEVKKILTTQLLSYLTYQQLQNLVKDIPALKDRTFIRQRLFNKRFVKNFAPVFDLSAQEVKERLKQLGEMRQWVLNNFPSDSLSDRILTQMLSLGIKINQFDLELFRAFQKQSQTELNYHHLRQRQQVQRNVAETRQRRRRAGNYHFNGCENRSHFDIVEDYLQAHFRINDKIEPFDQFFQEEYLNKKLARSRLLRGVKVPDLQKYFDSHQIERLNSVRHLTIAKGNPSFFSQGRPVTLSLQIKNVEKVQVLIYQIDLLSYYKRNLAELTEQVDLEGLVPTLQNQFNYSEPAIKLHTQNFTFESLQGKRGIFVVEFVGAGLVSRAVIRLGKLTVKEKMTVTGHVFHLFDEEMNICTGEEASLLIQGEMHYADHNGEIIIPFRKSPFQGKCVAVHKDFCTLIGITISNQVLQFYCNFTPLRETFLLNHKGQVLAQPQLLINTFACPLSLVDKAELIVNSTSKSGLLTTTTSPLKLAANKDLKLEFQVVPKLRLVELVVKIYMKQIGGTPTQLSSRFTVQFNQTDQVNSLAVQSLKHTDQGYILQVHGRNGQPKKSLVTNLVFTKEQKKTNATLQTDQNGEIFLGSLPKVSCFSSNFQKQGDIEIQNMQFIVHPYPQIVTLNNLKLAEGEIGHVPNRGIQEARLVQVLGNNRDEVVADLSSRLAFQPGSIAIGGLTPGLYILHYRGGQTTTIEVIEGKRIIDNTILNKSQMVIVNQAASCFCVTQSRVQSEGEALVYSASLVGGLQGMRVHLFLTNFECKSDLQSLPSLTIREEDDSRVNVRQRLNTYLSNKEIGDELKYAIERKNKKVFIGNSLTRPRLLLNPEFVRNTVFEAQSVVAQGEYGVREAAPHVDSWAVRSPQQAVNKASNNNKKVRCVRKDFIKNPGRIIVNIIPDQNGKIKIKLPVGYASLAAVFVGKRHTLLREHGLAGSKFQTRDLRHQPHLKVGTYYTLQRTSSILRKGDIFECKDVTSSQIRIVDSFSKLFQVLVSLSKGRPHLQRLKKFSFLKEWRSTPLDQKHELFSKNQGHELQLFLYINDPAYFDEYVRPYLNCKLQKKFMDYFLLGEEPELLKYLNPSLLASLHSLEQVCLVHFLANSGRKDRAKQLADLLQNKARLFVRNKKIFKNCFDTVLNVEQLMDLRAQVAAQSLPDYQNFNNAGIFNFGNAGNTAQFSMNQVPQMQMQMPQQYHPMQAPPIQMYQQQMPMHMHMGQPMPMGQMHMGQPMPMGQMHMGPIGFMANQPQRNAPGLFGSTVPSSSNMFSHAGLGGFGGTGGFGAIPSTFGGVPHAIPSPAPTSSLFSMPSYPQHVPSISVPQAFGQSPFVGAFDGSDKYNQIRKQTNLLEGYKSAETTGQFKEGNWVVEGQGQQGQFRLFYGQLAKWLADEETSVNFVSDQFIFLQSLKDACAVLTFMDLGQQACGESRVKDKGISIVMEGNALSLRKEVREAEFKGLEVTIVQKYFIQNQRVIDDGEGNIIQKKLERFEPNRVYGCQVVVTNSSIAELELDVLAEVPRGSIPVRSAEFTRSQNMLVKPYSTLSFQYFFYFPSCGKFDMYPASAARSGVVVAAAVPHQFVVDSISSAARQIRTITDVLETGTKSDILQFVATKNILNPKLFRFSDIYYLLGDKQFYQALLQRLRARLVFDPVCWSFAYYHFDLRGIAEHLSSPATQQQLRAHLSYFKSTLVEVDRLQYFEYMPLVNQRIYSIKGETNILNQQFKAQYKRFLLYLAQKREHSPEDRLMLAYYLSLQDRVETASQVLAAIDPAAVRTSLQYDYFRAYYDIYNDYPNFRLAREIAEKYLAYPVISWRNTFCDLANQLSEYDGQAPAPKHQGLVCLEKPEQKTPQQQALQHIEACISKGTIQVSHRNIPGFKVSFYPINLEVIFTRNPLIESCAKDFSLVKAAVSVDYKLQKLDTFGTLTVPIPEEFLKQNCYVVLETAKGRRVQLNHFSSGLKIEFDSEAGLLQVNDPEGKPLPKTYVKIVAQTNGRGFKFFKDGFTDIRGKFDYSAFSSADVTRFAVFIQSEDYGSIIKEVARPSLSHRSQPKVVLRSQNFQSKAQSQSAVQQASYNSRAGAGRK